MIEDLSVARLMLVRKYPYFRVAAFSLIPVERPGLGTLAVDKYWRLYYDPALTWSPQEMAAVLYHELCHLLRDHAARAEALGAERMRWNIAADAAINDDLVAAGETLPSNPILPGSLGLPERGVEEEYYHALSASSNQPEESSGSHGDGDARGSEDASDSSEGGKDKRSSGAEGKGSANSEARDPSDSPSGSEADGSEDSDSSEASESSESERENQGQKPATQQASSGDDAAESPSGDAAESSSAASPDNSAASAQPSRSTPTGSRGDGDATSGSQASVPAPTPGAGHCGSCAHGHREPWELDAPTDPSEGVSATEAEILRRRVAQEVRRFVESQRGIGREHREWARWADARLDSRVDWRRQLAELVRRAVSYVSGSADYTYSRPSRRQSASNIVLPALRQPVPDVAIIVDTSGSMSDRQLGAALTEVRNVLRSVGQHGARVVVADAEVHSVRRVLRDSQIELVGGGGTDMARAIKYAARLRPRPQVLVVLSDGQTPWPDECPPGMRVIVGRIGSRERCPKWARVVDIRDD